MLRRHFITPPLQGSVVQRLQRFATYTHLKQVVLRMITEDMRNRGKAPSFSNALQVWHSSVQPQLAMHGLCGEKKSLGCRCCGICSGRRHTISADCS